MKTIQSIHWKNIFAGIICLFFLYGCDKFVKGESENLAPFSEQTISLIGSLEYSLNDSELIYLRSIDKYFENEDTFTRYLALENQVINMLTALVAYSMQIVTISEQNTTDNVKANRLADVVLELRGLVTKDQVIVNENASVAEIEKTIKVVRATEDYLEALRLLLPVINEFSAHSGRVLDALRVEKQKVAGLIDKAIDKKYKSTIKFHRELRLVKDDIYETLYNLSQYSVTNDKQYLEKMKSYGMYPVLAALKNKKSLSVKEQEKLHREITARLRTVNENYQQLLPDVLEYDESVKELNKILETKEDAIREAHLTFVVWTRAYQKMASGKTDPAEWFDISDSGALLFGAAKKAAGL
jgi:uncharacterized membrane protein YkgB